MYIQSGAVLFNICDHDLPYPCTFQCICLLSYFKPPISFHAVFLYCVLLWVWSFELSKDVPVSLFSQHGQRKIAWYLHIQFMSDLVVSASRNTVSFDFFAVHEIYNILRRNQFLLPHISFVTGLKLSRPRIRMGSILHSRALPLVWMEMCLFVSIDFILCKPFFS